MESKEREEGTFPPEVAVTYNQIMTYFDYDKNIDIFNSVVRANLCPFSQKRRGVLEIGVGTGHFASRLSHFGYGIVGIDDSYMMLEELHKQYPDLDVRLQDVAELDLQGEQFDIVVSAAGPIRFNYYEDERVFEGYLQDWATTKEAIRRVREHLRPGGLLIMSQNSDPEHPGYFKSTGDDMEVPEGMVYRKRERRNRDFIFKERTLTRGDEEIWRIVHRFPWKTPQIANQTLEDIGFDVIGFDPTDTYHVSRKR